MKNESPELPHKMILYHGTNRKISNLKENSFLTNVLTEASAFASIKGGDLIYEFHVNENEVTRDRHTLTREWYFNIIKLKPYKVYYR